MLGGLSRTEQREEGSDADEDDGEPLDAVVQRKDKERKVKRGGATLEVNVASLNAKEVTGEFQVDPLFRKTSAAFDEAGARGLLLNNLHVQGACHLVFDSSDSAEATQETESSGAGGSRIDVSDILAVLGDLRLESLQLCPLVAPFKDTIHRLESGLRDSTPAAQLTKFSTSANSAASVPGGAFAALTAAALSKQQQDPMASTFVDGAGLDADLVFGVVDGNDAKRAAAAEQRMLRELREAQSADREEGEGEQADYDMPAYDYAAGT
jgi:hypothetical protein